MTPDVHEDPFVLQAFRRLRQAADAMDALPKKQRPAALVMMNQQVEALTKFVMEKAGEKATARFLRMSIQYVNSPVSKKAGSHK